MERQGEADAIFARNVIPHVADANDVVAGMALCLKPEGTGAIEFHRSDVILEELHYDSLYHEHLFYHSLQSMSSLLDRFGLFAFSLSFSFPFHQSVTSFQSRSIVVWVNLQF